MEEPEWANVHYEKPDFQAISYYSAPNSKPKYDSLDEVDPELLETFKRLGISVDEQKKLAALPLILSWIPFPLRQPSKRHWPKKELFSAPFQRRLRSIRNW